MEEKAEIRQKRKGGRRERVKGWIRILNQKTKLSPDGASGARSGHICARAYAVTPPAGRGMEN